MLFLGGRFHCGAGCIDALANLKLKNPRFIASILHGIYRAVDVLLDSISTCCDQICILEVWGF